MVRLGTPKNIEDYVMVDYDVGSLIQIGSIFPIWRDDEFMYFEKTEEFYNYVRKEKLIDERID